MVLILLAHKRLVWGVMQAALIAGLPGVMGCSRTSSEALGKRPIEQARTLPEPERPHKNTVAPRPEPPAPAPFVPIAPINPVSVVFEHACEPGERLTIAAVGDVLLHSRLQRQAVQQEGRFRSIWADVEDLIAGADIAYANLEGPAARGVLEGGVEAPEDPGFRFDGEVYSTWPRFNYHPLVVTDLKEAGFDVVSTSNNHTLDRGALGVDRTLEALRDQGLAATGTRMSQWKKEPDAHPWHALTQQRGWSIAWLGCTYGTNGLPDYKNQVLLCYEHREELLQVVKALAADPDIDAVIVTPHWGWEYLEKPRKAQRDLARELIEAGALAVLGGHVHVLQPWEKVVTPSGREGFVLYSLGNFVSNMAKVPERTSIMLLLGLTRSPSGEVSLNGVRHVPLWLQRRRGGLRAVVDMARSEETIPPEAALHVHRIFGSYNAHDGAAQGLATTPQCDKNWEPALEVHPHNGGPGGACRAGEDLGCSALKGEARCDTGAPQGFCALPCTGRCPKSRGGRTACIAPRRSGESEEREAGVCMVRCRKDSACRPGYVCRARQVFGGKRERKVCVPGVP